jgi:hypothetical protein
MKNILFLFVIIISFELHAQDKTLPYYEISAAAENFTAGSVASRMIDGLGFRFYWATEGLRTEDLNFKPSVDARTSEETIQHIYEMSRIIVNSTTNTVNIAGKHDKISFTEMRKQVLENLKTASERLRKSTNQEMKNFKIIFKNGDQVSEYPFWNQLNGPIADCLWHVGQVVSFRRSSGNPFNSKAEVFTGTLEK